MATGCHVQHYGAQKRAYSSLGMGAMNLEMESTLMDPKKEDTGPPIDISLVLPKESSHERTIISKASPGVQSSCSDACLICAEFHMLKLDQEARKVLPSEF